MATQPWTDMLFDIVVYQRNRALVPDEMLVPYWGRHIAWNPEATKILADGLTRAEVRARLLELGIDPRMTVNDYIHDPNVSYI